MMYDVEAQTKLQGSSAAFADSLVRAGFMRKVFGILFAQLALTTCIGASIVFHPPVKAFIAATPSLTLLAFMASMGTLLAFCFSTKARNQHPLNLVLLALFTASEGLLVGYASSTYKTDLVVQAFGMTAAVSAGLTLYALKSRHDFTSMGGFLYSMLLSLVFGMFLNLFLGVPAMSLFLSMGGAALFSVYLIYDVQMLMGGTHKFSLSPDEYIFGAIAIYLDIINLFLHILRILGSNRNN
eukprot:CAMPEP_0202409954 /NCGR_PEP_ID=MMETSP1128-20130828/18084_1 /ASSEMBLY_ACC=CAM_ASM_000463 /TAXON_ID=3047 /ORGANISM="Dunaliella tertiolecta, Strain CCMP1320" /LENGTH=239 /DNA_ID=CAMNT_0049015389 /DNA_START=61 /DNA_END=780 /DNA_ORIENTATION=+